MPWEASIVFFVAGMFVGWLEERARRRRRPIRQCTWCLRITDAREHAIAPDTCRGCEFKKQPQN